MDLTGKLLIAMPGMGDPRFGHSVVFLCSHGQDGAMGLIVNKPSQDLKVFDLLGQLDIEARPSVPNAPVYFGGPVETARGFVLHSPGNGNRAGSMKVNDGFAMTATVDILEDIAAGVGPGEAILALGYAGWGPGQLEGEIAQNGWLTGDAEPDLVFSQPDQTKWSAALNALGIDPLSLSAEAGRA
ncbi:YqgE/AlgH family protein [Chachezhania sediminis]|uniref:YqgE/AlgH family protein n=1 Tax=Chachezhania sediminis TaxID=2599291 RepID=UPI00131ABC66|nr:YqgE/AlgH family protein [Chachezhania sediminis]